MIYFIQAGEGGPIKIGYTSANPAVRMHSFQTGHHAELKLLAQYEGASREERNLHIRFDGARIRGEWFHPVASLMEFIDEVNAPADSEASA